MSLNNVFGAIAKSLVGHAGTMGATDAVRSFVRNLSPILAKDFTTVVNAQEPTVGSNAERQSFLNIAKQFLHAANETVGAEGLKTLRGILKEGSDLTPEHERPRPKWARASDSNLHRTSKEVVPFPGIA